tara:strand:- start:4001 stop:4120 length:120 start_codon:yes stop_codon:yes gene_type:complete
MKKLEQLSSVELFELLGENTMQSIMAQEILDRRLELELL